MHGLIVRTGYEVRSYTPHFDKLSGTFKYIAVFLQNL